MKRVPTATYLSVEEIEAQIECLEFDIMRLAPDSEQSRQIMGDIARLRVYAEMKRWVAAPSLRSQH